MDSGAKWSLAGVAIGFFLGEISSLLRHCYRIHRLKNALRSECESLLAQIPQLIDIFKKCIKQLEQQHYLPGPAVQGISTVYKSIITELTPYLSTKERNLLHVVYEKVRIGDEMLASHELDILQAVKEKLIDDPFKSYISRMNDQINAYECVKKLLQSYLNGEPDDVFYLNMSESERNRVSFR